jgi:signal transduction histidine kinase/CheY-like chemotaxis protein
MSAEAPLREAPATLSHRLVRYFAAHEVPESAAQEERRATNRAVVCAVLLAVFLAEFLTNRGPELQVANIALATVYGSAALVHAVLLRRNPDLGPALTYLFAIADPIALTMALDDDPRSMPFLNPLLLTVIVATGIRYGLRTMYLVWFAALFALLVAFTVEPYASRLAVTTPFALMLVLVPLFFSDLVRRIYRGKEIEVERARLAAMNEVVAARSAFLGRVSHEIRSPLQAMISALDLFELRHRGEPDDDELIGRMRRASLLLNTQLRDLLTLAKGQTGRIEMRPEPFEVVALMEAMAESARPLASEKGLQLILDTPREPVFVVADGARIDQVLSNLVLNSIRYTHTGQVRTSFDGYDAKSGHLRFTVADTGPGIPDSVVPTLFSPDKTFTATGRRGEGSGMGLAIVRMLIEHLGGEIAVTSRAGSGTRFSLKIPAVPAEGLDTAGDSPPTGRLLVVDDRVDVLDAVIAVIRDLGFECDRASSASSGAYLLATRRYDAALVDIDMPSKDGVQLVDEIRQGTGPNRNGAFIGMSAVEVSAAVRERFHACLTKPVDRTTLQHTLRGISRAAPPDQRRLWP